MTKDPDVIVVGAGAAGLAASETLAAAGLTVTILEARDRIGGRMLTRRDPEIGAPIELGAEFIHGRPHEILDRLQANGVRLTEVGGDQWCVREGKLRDCDFFSQVQDILDKMNAGSPDESFSAFLHRCFPTNDNPPLEEAKARALSYVSGFNAADPDLVSVHWLVEQMRAEEVIEGDRAFRSENGYADLVASYRDSLSRLDVPILTGTTVQKIEWKRGETVATVLSEGRELKFHAPRVLITLPLGVLQAASGQEGAVAFDPELPASTKAALDKLAMGKVIRIVLRFHDRFWDTIPAGTSKTLEQMSFLFSEDPWFPTWWTAMPDKAPLITGWATFRAAEGLSNRSHDFVVAQALRSLGTILHVDAEKLKRLLSAAYLHDWQSDPYARGAYSYAKSGADGAQKALSEPIDNTLFLAGEATDVTGNNGTVHGAVASGQRAAKQILK